MGGSGQVWPDDLEMGDRIEFDGNEYVVDGIGPAEATLERIGDGDFQLEVFRWAFTDNVGLELKTDMTQEEFGRSVEPDS